MIYLKVKYILIIIRSLELINFISFKDRNIRCKKVFAQNLIFFVSFFCSINLQLKTYTSSCIYSLLNLYYNVPTIIKQSVNNYSGKKFN